MQYELGPKCNERPKCNRRLVLDAIKVLNVINVDPTSNKPLVLNVTSPYYT